MKETEIALLFDKEGDQEVFDNFAVEIEKTRVGDYLPPHLENLLFVIQQIERKLQNLQEKINVSNESTENIYEFTINRCLRLMNCWLLFFINRKKFQLTTAGIKIEFKKVLNYVELENIENKTVREIDIDFAKLFILNTNLFELKVKEQLAAFHHELTHDEIISKVLSTFYEQNLSFQIQISIGKDARDNLDLHDGEDVVYSWNVEIWIGTRNAVEANKFMNLVSSILGYIQNVEIEIVDSGIGSFFQKWIIRFRGWISKDETVRIVEKGLKAMESVALDKYIEPTEKSKIERKKIEEDIKRMMPEDEALEFNKLTLQEKKEDIKYKQLLNAKLKLDMYKGLSELLRDGLLDTDSNFNIMINEVLLIDKQNNQLEIGDIDEIDKKSKKERINTPNKP